MDALLLVVGVVIGAGIVYWILRAQRDAEREMLRTEIVQAYRARAETEQARIVRSYEARIHALKARQADAVIHARRESADQSRAVLKGKMAEQMAPLLPGFDYWPADARFLGDPVDYVIFNGYSACKDDGAGGDALEVVILDIKQGKSMLTQSQRQIARAVEAGRVRFEVVRVFADGTIRSHTWGSRRDGWDGSPDPE